VEPEDPYPLGIGKHSRIKTAKRAGVTKEENHDDVVRESMGGWGFVLLAVSSLVFWGAVIAGGVALFRYLNRTTAKTASSEIRPTPEQLLAERFARGEIDEEEFQQRLDTLRGAGPVAGG
jgi:putative membrane protein